MKKTIDIICGYWVYFLAGVILTVILQTSTLKKDISREDKKNEIPDLPGVGILFNACIKYRVPFEIALAVATVESGCDHNIRDNRNKNGTRDIGYMQLNSLYHDERAARDIEWNIYSGVKYLRKMYEETGSWMAAIVRYNAGYGHDKAIQYLEKVLNILSDNKF